MEVSNNWYKNNDSDVIWWLDTSEYEGLWICSFDKKTKFNMFADYPYKLNKEQKEIFDNENLFWKDFFKDRE